MIRVSQIRLGGSSGRVRFVIDDVNVRLAVERSQYLDIDGKLITEDYRALLKCDLRKALQEKFGSLTDFLRRWSCAERKQAVLEELKNMYTIRTPATGCRKRQRTGRV